MPTLGNIYRIPLRLWCPAGAYYFQADSLHTFSRPFGNNVNIYLIDTAVNDRFGRDSVQNLITRSNIYSFTLPRDYTEASPLMGRFALLFDPLTPIEKQVSKAPLQPLRLWPNPSAKHVTVFYPESGTLQVCDLQGRQVQSRLVRKEEQVSLDVSSLPKGMYQVRIGSQTRPLVVE